MFIATTSKTTYWEWHIARNNSPVHSRGGRKIAGFAGSRLTMPIVRTGQAAGLRKAHFLINHSYRRTLAGR